MAVHIHPAKRVKGVFYVNGKAVSLSDYRQCRYNDLEQHEVSSFEDYLKANKL